MRYLGLVFFGIVLWAGQAFANETVHGWDDFEFGQQKAAAKSYLGLLCERVSSAHSDEMQGENCILDAPPFSGETGDISLLFKRAFFKSNQTLNNISFRLPYSSNRLQHYRSHFARTSGVSTKWDCSKETKLSFATLKTCGQDFADHWIHLELLHFDENKTIQITYWNFQNRIFLLK